jgi:hypothetical protein
VLTTFFKEDIVTLPEYHTDFSTNCTKTVAERYVVRYGLLLALKNLFTRQNFNQRKLAAIHHSNTTPVEAQELNGKGS